MADPKSRKKVKGDPQRNLRVASDSLTNANRNNPWIQRYLQGNDLSIPDPYNPGSGKTSTHGLSYHPYSQDSAMIFPEIIQQGDSLIHMNNDEAREYAMQNKTGINTDLELAKYYSKNGLIDHTKYPEGGKVKGDPKFSKLDQRIYDAVGPYFYSTNKATIKQTLKNVINKDTYFGEEGRQTEDPYFNEMFKYALGSGELSDLQHFQSSPYKPSKATDDSAEYLRIKDLDRISFIKNQQEFLKNTGLTKDNIVSSQLPTTTPNIDPGHTFGNLTMGKGKDDRGNYISIYDKWDFANKKANRFLDRKPEMYDRIYYEKEGDSYKYIDPTQAGRKSFNMKNNNLQEFGTGGILAQAGMGAASGALAGSVVPGWGTAVGAIGGFAAGLYKGIKGDRAEQEQADLLTQQQEMMGQQDLGINPMSRAQNRPTFPMGGLIPYGDVPVELENDEVFRKPGEDKIFEVDGKTHSQGGEPYKLPVGTEVLGKNPNPVTGNAFKQDGMKLKKEQDRILAKASKPGTIGKESDSRNLKRLMGEYNNLFLAQEKLRKGGTVKSMADGGIVQRMFGGGFATGLLGGGDPTQISLGGFGLGGQYTPQPSDAYKNKTGLGDWWDYSAKPGIKNAWQGAGGLGGLASTAAQLAPMAYNLIQGSRPAEQLNPQDFYNKQGNQAINLMAGREFDVGPTLEANRNASAIGRYNLSQSGASAGQQYSGIQGLAAGRMRADASAYAQKNNMDNQYAAQEAQTRLGVGDQRAGMKFNVAGINQQADAAQRAYLGQGFNDLSEWAQRQALMKNQKERDSQLAGLYPDMFSSVYPWMQGAQNINKQYS